MSQPPSPSGQAQILFLEACCHVGKETLCAIAKDKRSGKYFLKAAMKDFDVGYQMMDNFGVRAVYMDLEKPETAPSAFRGVTKVLFFASIGSNDIEQTESLVTQATTAGVENIVIVSSGGEKTQTNRDAHFQRLENILRGSSLKWTLVKCFSYMEYFIEMETVIKEGKVVIPIGNGKFSPISVSDAGEAIANIVLSSTEEHVNKCYSLTGPQILSGEDITNTFNKIFGKNFEFISPTKEDAIRQYKKIGMGQSTSEKLAELFDTISRKELEIMTNDAEKLLARAPLTFEEVINMHRNHFLARPPNVCPL